MKRILIHARSTKPFSFPVAYAKRLERKGKIGILTTIQYLHWQADLVKMIKGSMRLGQVLGCTRNFDKSVDAYLYVGTGRFHPLNIRLQTERPVFTFNPDTKEVGEIGDRDLKPILQKKQGAMLKFLTSERIGILVSTKEGQSRIDEAEKLRIQLKKDGKRPYLFVSETLDIQGLEAFPKVEVFVNTACPRIQEDESPRPIINLDDISIVDM